MGETAKRQVAEWRAAQPSLWRVRADRCLFGPMVTAELLSARTAYLSPLQARELAAELVAAAELAERGGA